MFKVYPNATEALAEPLRDGMTIMVGDFGLTGPFPYLIALVLSSAANVRFRAVSMIGQATG